jgi:hypothetical protein
MAWSRGFPLSDRLRRYLLLGIEEMGSDSNSSAGSKIDEHIACRQFLNHWACIFYFYDH